jgi:hypothetical protein
LLREMGLLGSSAPMGAAATIWRMLSQALSASVRHAQNLPPATLLRESKIANALWRCGVDQNQQAARWPIGI